MSLLQIKRGDGLPLLHRLYDVYHILGIIAFGEEIKQRRGKCKQYRDADDKLRQHLTGKAFHGSIHLYPVPYTFLTHIPYACLRQLRLQVLDVRIDKVVVVQHVCHITAEVFGD